MYQFARLTLWLLFPLLLLSLAPPAWSDDTKAAAEKDQDEKKVEEKPKTAKLASIVLSGSLAETSGQGGLFGEIEQNLRKTIERLDKAAKDDSISGVVLKLDDVSLGRGRVDELRAAIGRVRAAGHKVYCRMDSADTAHYLVASACDEIVLPPSGVVMLPGVRLEVTFYKQLFDKLDVQADFLHMGAFKGAAEPYTRDKLSDEVRQNLTAIVDDFYDQMIHTIASDRKLAPEKVKELVDQGLLSAQAAKEAGLIDAVAYSDEYEADLQKSLGWTSWNSSPAMARRRSIRTSPARRILQAAANDDGWRSQHVDQQDQEESGDCLCGGSHFERQEFQ